MQNPFCLLHSRFSILHYFLSPCHLVIFGVGTDISSAGLLAGPHRAYLAKGSRSFAISHLANGPWRSEGVRRDCACGSGTELCDQGPMGGSDQHTVHVQPRRGNIPHSTFRGSDAANEVRVSCRRRSQLERMEPFSNGERGGGTVFVSLFWRCTV